MFYLRITGEIYDVSKLEYCDAYVATNLESGLKYLIPKDELTSKVTTDEGEKPLFEPVDFKNILKSFSSEDLLNELVRRGELPEGSKIKSDCIIEEYYKICRKVAPNNYPHILKPNTFTEDYNKAVESLAFYRSTESSPENLYIVCTRSTVLED